MNETPGAAVARLDEVPAWNFTRVARLVGNRLAERLVDQGLNPIQFGVLAFLSDRTEMTNAEISRAVYLRPQSIAPLLDQLEKRGLTRRTGDREKGRRNPVHITDTGRTALNEVWASATKTNDLTDAGLSQHEANELNRLLLKIIHSASD